MHTKMLIACRDCGHQISRNAAACPNCGAKVKRTSATASGCLTLIVILVVVGVLSKIVGNSGSTPSTGATREQPAPVNTDSRGNAVPALVTNDAELLLYRCGKPDKDDSTEYDNPRPPIPSRIITYKNSHLKFAYIPGGDTKLNDPPPYDWKLLGILDTQTNKPIDAAALETTLQKRLKCSLPK
jgi:DNA-directed RNA polymerase subunit RPC12/RpoP